MNTSPRISLISNLSSNEPITIGQFAYFRGRFRNRLHQIILDAFLKKKETGMTKAMLARRMGKQPEQVTRWLAGPGNLRLDTVSDLLLAMGCELKFDAGSIDEFTPANWAHEFSFLRKEFSTGSQVSSRCFSIRGSASTESEVDVILVAATTSAKVKVTVKNKEKICAD